MITRSGHGTVGIVVLGDFNPAIFHPSWLARHRLLPQDEIDRAELEVVSREATIFSVGWARVEVTLQRMALLTTTEAPTAEPLRDLAISILGLLEHTPAHAFGLNHEAVFELEAEEEWHELGFRLAPRGNWDDVLDSPGLASLTVQGRRDGIPGVVNVTVGPTTRASNGVLVVVNDHHAPEPENEGQPLRAGDLVPMLETAWGEAEDRAERIFHRVEKWA